ncbi:MAG TPA: OmpA family protein [Flavihumibacter sp.]|nr:OmpA family protein [Bacteroidota bacterium]HOA37192.1 OmpA family protein [Flavihumibacter sp.]HPZ86579.1 OmpA family protein [Flavihumibacter sp.]HQD08812.1 OmpA family protein [Flavihumibacter sp.]
MKKFSQTLFAVAAGTILLAGCKSMNNTQKGAVIGAGGGAAIGAVVGKAAGNTGLGAIIGAVVGGGAGVLIGKKMDKQAREIKQEIPDAKVERVEEGIVVEFDSEILFGFDKSDLNAAAFAQLDKLVTILNKYPETNLEVAGHTDSKGAAEYNQALSERRANTVAQYIESKGVAVGRVKTKGYGEFEPRYPNDTDENMAKNRRVDFLITANDAMKEAAKKEAAQSN